MNGGVKEQMNEWMNTLTWTLLSAIVSPSLHAYNADLFVPLALFLFNNLLLTEAINTDTLVVLIYI